MLLKIMKDYKSEHHLGNQHEVFKAILMDQCLNSMHNDKKNNLCKLINLSTPEKE